jgi:PAS domain S-box-containing protein
VATGSQTEFEHLYDAEGLKLWVSWKAVKFEDGLFVSVEDITQRKEAEAREEAQRHFINRVSAIVPDLVTVTEMPSKRILYANRQTLSGFPGAGLLHLSPQERDRQFQVHPEDASQLRHYYERVMRLADGEVVTFDYRARSGTAAWRCYRVRGAVFDRAISGRVTAVLHITQDITAQRVAEEELQAEHYFLEQVTDNTPHLIYVFDFDEQRFIYINRRITALTGADPEYVYGMGTHLFRKVLHRDDLSRWIEYIEGLSSLGPGEVRDCEFRLHVGDGWRWFRSRDHIFKTEGGLVKQAIGLAEDITYERLLREKVQGEPGLN